MNPGGEVAVSQDQATALQPGNIARLHLKKIKIKIKKNIDNVCGQSLFATSDPLPPFSMLLCAAGGQPLSYHLGLLDLWLLVGFGQWETPVGDKRSEGKG